MGLADENKLEITAYHEAGHAVAAALLKLKFKEVCIISDPDDDSLGHIRHEPWETADIETLQFGVITPRLRDQVDRRVISSLAGGLAEGEFTGEYNADGSHRDRSNAYSLAEQIVSSMKELDAYLAWLWIRAEGFIRRPFNWLCIEAVAAALLKHKELTARQVHAAISSVKDMPIKEQKARMQARMEKWQEEAEQVEADALPGRGTISNNDQLDPIIADAMSRSVTS